ncbi:PREDICTED: N-myc-interactor [Nanorana parkeri]|uniref:N-myc-interactor n=1 Tax=Nanorana parkeri TaxID=125878 RepID=UPI0008548061|nr:PREDICTED: N-myc-interactor [Nanorana parkeri]
MTPRVLRAPGGEEAARTGLAARRDPGSELWSGREAGSFSDFSDTIKVVFCFTNLTCKGSLLYIIVNIFYYSFYVFSKVNISMEDIQKLHEELELWKKQCDETNKQKLAKNLTKVSMDDRQDELQKELEGLLKKKKNVQDYLKEQETHFKVNSPLPQKNLNFKSNPASEENQIDVEPMDITYTCQIVSGHPYILGDGQALVTFEEERVARSIIAKKRHKLDNDNTKVPVEAAEPQLGKSVKFEVNMNISRKKLKISNLPKDMPEEVLKDKLELYFYKSGVGGGEIEKVDYDRNNNTACVTYLQNGVAQRVLKEEFHPFRAGGATCEVEVMPCVDIELNKLQMFSAVSSRSVLLTGIKNLDDEDEDDVQDVIQIHFQKESNGGGEVEKTLFSKDRKKYLIFDEDCK